MLAVGPESEVKLTILAHAGSQCLLVHAASYGYGSKQLPICFAENKMPMKPENGYMIVNNESDPSKMGHWILIYKNNDKHYFFDSFGFHPSIYVGNIASYCNTYNNIQLLLKKAIQSSQSHMMGPVNFLVSKK